MDANAWIDDAADGATGRERRARIVRARSAGYVLGDLELPPYVTPAPEWVARWGNSAPPAGTVLRWSNLDGSLAGVAVATGDDQWSTTVGEVRGGSITFAGLARIIANSPCDVAVGWREIPAIEARPAGDAAVSDWASQFIPRGEATPASAAGPDVVTGG